MRLKDKAIIVTGGTSGIGAAIATAAIREGAKVLVHGINEEEGRSTIERLGANAVLCIADLNEDSAPQEIVEAALKAFGKIDGIVNNAAIFGGTNIADQEIEHFRRMMQINLTAPLFLIKAAFEELKKTGGCVLNIGSINAHAGESKLLAYSISNGLDAGVNLSYDQAFETRFSADLKYRFGGNSNKTASEKKALQTPVIQALKETVKNRDVRVHDLEMCNTQEEIMWIDGGCSIIDGRGYIDQSDLRWGNY